MKMSTAAENAAVNGVTALINAGSPPGSICIFTGSYPTNTTDANTGTLLTQQFFSNVSFPNSSGGTANCTNLANNTSIAANGTAGYYRIFDYANNVIGQGTVATANGDIIVNTLAFTAGGTFAMVYLAITQPAGT